MSQYFNSDSVLFGTWNKHVEFAFHYKIMFATTLLEYIYKKVVFQFFYIRIQ